MEIYNLFEASKSLIKLFQSGEYEKYILLIMNRSKTIFPNKYKQVPNQSNGECDFLDENKNAKYDAKLPLTSDYFEMLTNGAKHEPQIAEWIKKLINEEAEFKSMRMRQDNDYSIRNSMLYSVVKKQIEKDKNDENIIFFIPFPIVLAVPDSVHLQFASDFLWMIMGQIKEDINLSGREIFFVFPSSAKNVFAVRKSSAHITEYVECEELGQYFTYEITGVKK